MRQDSTWVVVVMGDTPPPSPLDATFRREADEWAMTSPQFESQTDPLAVWNLAAEMLRGSGMSVKEVVQRIDEPDRSGHLIVSPFSTVYVERPPK